MSSVILSHIPVIIGILHNSWYSVDSVELSLALCVPEMAYCEEPPFPTDLERTHGWPLCLSMTRLEWLDLSWVEWLLCARPFPILFIEFLSTSKKDVINLSFLMKKGGFKTITWLPRVKQRQYQTSKHIFNHYAMQTSCMKHATIKAKPVLKRGIHMLKGFIFVKLPFKFWS